MILVVVLVSLGFLDFSVLFWFWWCAWFSPLRAPRDVDNIDGKDATSKFGVAVVRLLGIQRRGPRRSALRPRRTVPPPGIPGRGGRYRVLDPVHAHLKGHGVHGVRNCQQDEAARHDPVCALALYSAYSG